MNEQIDRRTFGKTIITGAGLVAGTQIISLANDKIDAVTQPTLVAPDGIFKNGWQGQHLPTAGTLSEDGKVFYENARNIPVVKNTDVLVCGGGPAGYAAALAAARSGAKTCLLEVNGCIGGVWTAGALSLIIDAGNKPGIMRELRALLEQQDASVPVGSSIAYHPDKMKLILEAQLLEAGVEMRLHTRVVGAVTDRHKKLAVVVTESKSGRESWVAKSFVDCTGDGDLASQAGCTFEFGHPETHATQPMSLMVLMTGLDKEKVAPFVRGDAEPRGLGNPKKNLLEEMRRAGVDPSYHGPTIFRLQDHGMYAMMANHQYGVYAVNADHVTNATLAARREVHKLVNALRKLGGVWEQLQLIATGEQIGTREGRRIQGRYRVTAEDLRAGAKFDDGICPVRFGIDVHSTDPKKTKSIESKPFKSKPYDIPLRALIARDVTGLMMAGRCISGDFIAHSSYRVTGDAVTMGEAAGVTSAIAALQKTLPHEIPFEDINQKLNAIREDAVQRVAGT